MGSSRSKGLWREDFNSQSSNPYQAKTSKWQTNHRCEKSWLSSDTLIELVWENDPHLSTVFPWWVRSLPARTKLDWDAIQLLEVFFGRRPRTPSSFENGCWKTKMYSNCLTWRWGKGIGKSSLDGMVLSSDHPQQWPKQFEYHTAT